MKRALLVASLLLIAMGLSAQTFYVRQGATGTGDGSNWTNAYTALPTTLQRGATYYVAAGNYPQYIFQDPESGTTYITVKKATTSDHGTNTGWSASYGNGVAHFQDFVFFTGYYIIDGQTGGGPGSWGTGFGFSIHPDSAKYLVNFAKPGFGHTGQLATHVTLEHINMAGGGYNSPTGNDGIFAIETTNQPGLGVDNLTISYCYIHDTRVGTDPLYIQWANNVTVQYTYIARNMSGASHSQGMILDGTNNTVIRYNRFEDINGSAIINIGKIMSGTSVNNNIQIYGNLFMDSVGQPSSGAGVGDGAIANVGATTGYDVTGAKIYNNTFVRLTGMNTGINIPIGSNNLVYNNIWWDCTDPSTGQGLTYMYVAGTEDYNTFINSLKPNWTVNTHDVVQSTGDPFANSANNNFSLSGPTAPGLALSAPFNVDMLGHTSDINGAWDRGAFQYAGPATPPAPSDLHVITP